MGVYRVIRRRATAWLLLVCSRLRGRWLMADGVGLGLNSVSSSATRDGRLVVVVIAWTEATVEATAPATTTGCSSVPTSRQRKQTIKSQDIGTTGALDCHI
ncbi:hypothetical protein BJY04DRAFT_202358 [Aspergillus karnatakaensis]|uniref:uncharacterized protein n=1 Tax=Aspergillus karnatakaensis TaxID=1810916 RepID=UPI003CCD5B55